MWAECILTRETNDICEFIIMPYIVYMFTLLNRRHRQKRKKALSRYCSVGGETQVR